mgnify:CR=1 FL=1
MICGNILTHLGLVVVVFMLFSCSYALDCCGAGSSLCPLLVFV